MSGHALLLFQTALLVAISLSVLYPVVAYSRSVLHTEAIVALAVSTLVFTAGALVEHAAGEGAVAEGVYLFSALLFAGSVWLFAREFVRPGEPSFADDGPAPGSVPEFAERDDSAGGFADAPTEPAEGGFAEDGTGGFAEGSDDAADGFADATDSATEQGAGDASGGEDGE